MKLFFAVLGVTFFMTQVFATDAAQVIKCVEDLRRYHSFSNTDAASVCRGTTDAAAVVKCVQELKRYQSFSNHDAALACGICRY